MKLTGNKCKDFKMCDHGTDSCETLTSVSDFLGCGFSYPTIGTGYHKGPPTQIYIQVFWGKMLCCSFIATPVRNKGQYDGCTTHTLAPKVLQVLM